MRPRWNENAALLLWFLDTTAFLRTGFTPWTVRIILAKRCGTPRMGLDLLPTGCRHGHAIWTTSGWTDFQSLG